MNAGSTHEEVPLGAVAGGGGAEEDARVEAEDLERVVELGEDVGEVDRRHGDRRQRHVRRGEVEAREVRQLDVNGRQRDRGQPQGKVGDWQVDAREGEASKVDAAEAERG